MKIAIQHKDFIEGFVKCAHDHGVDESTASVLLARVLRTLDEDPATTYLSKSARFGAIGKAFGGLKNMSRGKKIGLGAAGVGSVGTGLGVQHLLNRPQQVELNTGTFAPFRDSLQQGANAVAGAATQGTPGTYSAPVDFTMDRLPGGSQATPGASTTATPSSDPFAQADTKQELATSEYLKNKTAIENELASIESSNMNVIDKTRQARLTKQKLYALQSGYKENSRNWEQLEEKYDANRFEDIGRIRDTYQRSLDRGNTIAERMELERTNPWYKNIVTKPMNRLIYGASPNAEENWSAAIDGNKALLRSAEALPENYYANSEY